MRNDSIVYVVDDNEGSAASIAALVTSIGAAAEIFHSAEAFLAAYDGRANACLVLDLRLPDMNGLELQQTLADRGLEIPVVMVSGHADQELSNKALQNGAVACLEKPFPGERLCELVRAALSD